MLSTTTLKSLNWQIEKLDGAQIASRSLKEKIHTFDINSTFYNSLISKVKVKLWNGLTFL